MVFVRCSIALACPLLLLAVRESWIDWLSVNIRQEQICTTVAWESDEQTRGELWKNLCILKYIHWVRPNTLFSLFFSASICNLHNIAASSTSNRRTTPAKQQQSTIIKCHARRVQPPLNISVLLGWFAELKVLFYDRRNFSHFFRAPLGFFFCLARLFFFHSISREWVMKLL